MPRLVDYTARWALLRESLENLIHREGLPGLTLTAVAAEAGLSLATLRRLAPTMAGLQSSVWLEVTRRITKREILRYWPPGGDTVTRVTEALASYLPFDEDARRDHRVVRLLEVVAETDGSVAEEMILDFTEARVEAYRRAIRHLGVTHERDIVHTQALLLGLTELLVRDTVRPRVSPRVTAGTAREVLGHHVERLAATAGPLPAEAARPTDGEG